MKLNHPDRCLIAGRLREIADYLEQSDDTVPLHPDLQYLLFHFGIARTRYRPTTDDTTEACCRRRVEANIALSKHLTHLSEPKKRIAL